MADIVADAACYGTTPELNRHRGFVPVDLLSIIRDVLFRAAQISPLLSSFEEDERLRLMMSNDLNFRKMHMICVSIGIFMRNYRLFDNEFSINFCKNLME